MARNINYAIRLLLNCITFVFTMKYLSYFFQTSNVSYVVVVFFHLFTDTSPVPVLREIVSEVQRQRRFLQLEAYSFLFWCERAFTVTKNIINFFL